MTEPTEPTLCCGEKPEGVAGKPLLPACMLCEKSPNYFRDEPAMAKRLETNDAALAEVYRNA